MICSGNRASLWSTLRCCLMPSLVEKEALVMRLSALSTDAVQGTSSLQPKFLAQLFSQVRESCFVPRQKLVPTGLPGGIRSSLRL